MPGAEWRLKWMTISRRLRRSRESGNLASFVVRHWVPAFAGTTRVLRNLSLFSAIVSNRVPLRARPWLGVALAVVLAGIASIALRQDSNWDLQNYHLYNAWAFVHRRFGVDWAPAQLQSFYSPFLDLPFYAMLAADVPPRLIAFALALPTGIAWFFFARIVVMLFASAPTGVRGPAILAAIAIGVTAPMSVSLIGLTMNDWYVAAFVMAAVWLVVRSCGEGGAPSMRTLLAAGALAGAGAGLKLTGTIYCVGLIGGLLATGSDWRGRARAALIAGSAVAIAFAITAGPWMWLMYERYGNPLFPYFNDVFRSPWADPVAFSATLFGPASASRVARVSVRAAVEPPGLRFRGRIPRCPSRVAVRPGAGIDRVGSNQDPIHTLGGRPRTRPRGASSAPSSWHRLLHGQSFIEYSAISFRSNCWPGR